MPVRTLVLVMAPVTLRYHFRNGLVHFWRACGRCCASKHTSNQVWWVWSTGETL